MSNSEIHMITVCAYVRMRVYDVPTTLSRNPAQRRVTLRLECRQFTSVPDMAALRQEHRYGLSCGKINKSIPNKTIFHVKLTDTAIRTLEAYKNLKVTLLVLFRVYLLHWPQWDRKKSSELRTSKQFLSSVVRKVLIYLTRVRRFKCHMLSWRKSDTSSCYCSLKVCLIYFCLFVLLSCYKINENVSRVIFFVKPVGIVFKPPVFRFRFKVAALFLLTNDTKCNMTLP